MTLSKSVLEAELLKIYDPSDKVNGFPSSTAAYAAAFRAAYDTYIIGNAEDLSGDLVATVNSAGLESSLAANLPKGTDNPPDGPTAADAAKAYADAWVIYWTGAIFATGGLVAGTGSPCANVGGNGIFGSEISSLVTAVIKTTLESSLTSEFEDQGASSENPKTAAEAASNIAQIFHDATTTDITVVITGLDTTLPPAGPLPITNTCQVF